MATNKKPKSKILKAIFQAPAKSNYFLCCSVDWLLFHYKKIKTIIYLCTTNDNANIVVTLITFCKS